MSGKKGQREVLGGHSTHCPDGIQNQFPKYQDLITLEAESYLAVPMYNLDRQVMGHLAILDTKPMPDITLAQPILELYALRASTELERNRLTQALTQSKEDLRYAGGQGDDPSRGLRYRSVPSRKAGNRARCRAYTEKKSTGCQGH